MSVPASFGEDFAPLDCLIANAGTHCWESSWSRRVGFHWFITTKFQRLGMLCVSGSSCGWNQWRGAADAMDWVEGRKHIVNKAVCVSLQVLNRVTCLKFRCKFVAISLRFRCMCCPCVLNYH